MPCTEFTILEVLPYDTQRPVLILEVTSAK
jgi:hypothetical protein